MTGKERVSELKQRLRTMPEGEAALRSRVFEDMLATGASPAFAGVCAFGCSLDKLHDFAAEIAARLTAEEEIH